MKRPLAVMLAVLTVGAGQTPAWCVAVTAVTRTGPVSPVPAVGSLPLGTGALGSIETGSLLAPPGLSPALIRVRTPEAVPSVIESRTQALGRSLAAPAPQPASVPLPVRRAALRGTSDATVPALGAPQRGRLEAPSRTDGVSRLISSLSVSQAQDRRSLLSAGPASSYGIAREGFARLLEEGLIRTRDDSLPAARPAPPAASRSGLKRASELAGKVIGADTRERPIGSLSPQKRSTLRRYLAATSAYKLGMDAMGVVIPLLTLSLFHAYIWPGIFYTAWMASQAVFSSLSGGLLDRRSPGKVLGWSMILQSLTVTGMLGLFAADHFFPAVLGFPLVAPWSLLSLYALAGGFMGVAETARQVIPARIIGENEKELKIFNAKTHIAYESAGVASPLLAGFIIKLFGLVPAILLHPPAYLLAGILFTTLKVPKSRGPTAHEAATANALASEDLRLEVPAARRNRVQRVFTDLLQGAKTVWSKPVFRWATLAMVLPMLLHRILEGILIPVAASAFLANAAAAAWLIGASNLGELIGASLLMRAMVSEKDGAFKHSHFWARLMAVGLLGILILPFSKELFLLLPIISMSSTTWASSDLSLRSKLQNQIPRKYRGRAFGFINALSFLLILGSTTGIGYLMDLLTPMYVFYGISAAVVAVAAAMLYASTRIRHKNPA